MGQLLSANEAAEHSSHSLFDHSDKKYVLRKQPPGKLLDPTAHNMEREHRIMKALDGVVPVPKMLAYCGDASVLGGTFYIMSFLNGRIFMDARLPKVSKAERRLW